MLSMCVKNLESKILSDFKLIFAKSQKIPCWKDGWVGGWMDGWVDGWMGANAGLRIAYSNQKVKILIKFGINN